MKPLRPTLWILEDESDLRTLLEYFAENKGFATHSFATVGSAWTELEHEQKTPPVGIISDYHLTDGTSLDWLKRARQVFPDAYIVCLSGSLTSRISEELNELNVRYLAKPTRLSELIDVLAKATINKRAIEEPPKPPEPSMKPSRFSPHKPK